MAFLDSVKNLMKFNKNNEIKQKDKGKRVFRSPLTFGNQSVKR